MEFWGIEVKPNQTVKCEPGDDRLLHLSLATLADSKKSAENVVLYVTFNKQKLVIGTLSAEKCPQINHDLIFEKEFELSHNSKNATVHFTGYKSIQDDDVPSDFDDSSEEEDAKLASKTNGALKVKLDDVKKGTTQKAEAGKAVKAEKKDSDDDDEDSDDDDEEDSDDDEDMVDAGNSDDEEDESDDEEEEEEEEDSSEEEEETPEPAKGKKRPAEVANKAGDSEKKTKLATPADGKKGGEAKKGTTTPAKSDKGKQQQTPKSAGSVSCKSCSKTFNSGGALESHTKAKHSAK